MARLPRKPAISMAKPSTFQPEESPIEAWRRPSRRARLRGFLAWLGRVCLFLLALGYFTGRVLTDHYSWTQWLFWAPPEAWLLGAWVLVMVTAALVPRGPRRRWRRLSLVLVAAVLTLHVATAHWRLQNALLRTPGPTALRVYHWNATEATDESMQSFLREADPFGIERSSSAVVVLANPPLRLQWGEIVRMLANAPISQQDLPRHFSRGGRFVIISGPPMSESGWVSLDLRGETNEPDLLDHGTAIYARLETRAGPAVLWGWDWPSDPARGRMAFVEPSRAAIESSVHLRFRPTAAGPRRRSEIEGFPEPEIVVGDFNTGRGSAAIDALLPGLSDAHAKAGIGPDYGWPRFVRLRGKDHTTIPFLGLDQALIDRARWRATAYRMIDLGEGTHRAQEMILTPARRGE
ncbi:MAG: hypothetical protein ACFCBV_00790 [Phycisphaerales bacterium]